MEPKVVAIDTETTGVEWEDELFGISYAIEEGSYYVDVRDKDEASKAFIADLTVDLWWSNCELVFHNIKFDLHKLVKHGIINYEWCRNNLHRFHDTQLMANIYDSYEEVKLKDCARIYLKQETDEAKVLNAWFRSEKRKKAEGYHIIPKEILEPYAKKDAEYTLGLYNYFKPKFSEKEWAFYRRKMVLSIDVLDIEKNGMATNQDKIKAVIEQQTQTIESCRETVSKIAGPLFNPNSSKQILAWLEGQGVEVPNTKAETLKDLDIPLISAILELRKTQKLRDTYMMNMLGRDTLHAQLNLTSRTGRMRSAPEA